MLNRERHWGRSKREMLGLVVWRIRQEEITEEVETAKQKKKVV